MSPRTRTTSASPPTSNIESEGEDFATALGRVVTCFFGFGLGFVAPAGFFVEGRDVFSFVRTGVRAWGAGGGVTAGGGESRVGSTGAGAGGG